MAGEALVPTTRWLKAFTAQSAGKDVIAGLVLSILLVPQAMAYAQLAGLPPQMGLFAALTPPILYFFFGTSPFVVGGPGSPRVAGDQRSCREYGAGGASRRGDHRDRGGHSSRRSRCVRPRQAG